MKKQPPLADEEVLNNLKNFFFENYLPAHDPAEPGVIFKSTNEIYFSFYMLYPNKGYRPETVVQWLNEGGFQMIDMGYGTMKFEWMLKFNSSASKERKPVL